MGRFKVSATFRSFTWLLIPVTLHFKRQDFLPLPQSAPVFVPSRTFQRNLLCLYRAVVGVFLLTQVCALLSSPDSSLDVQSAAGRGPSLFWFLASCRVSPYRWTCGSRVTLSNNSVICR